MSSPFRLFLLLNLALAVALPARADAAAPTGFSMVSVGRLLDGTDQPVEAEGLQMTFKLFHASAPIDGEQPVWTGTYAVSVHQGMYSVVLGGASDADEIPATIFDGGLIYLEASIGTVTLLPRERIGMTPLAAGSLTLGGHDASEYALKTDLDPLLADVQTQLGTKANQADLDALTAATYTKTDVDGKLQTVSATEATDVAALEASLATEQTTQTNQGSAITSLQASVSANHDQLSADSASISSLQSGLSATNSSVANLQSGLASANTNVTNLQSGLASANSNIASVQSSLSKYLPLTGGDVTGKLGVGVANPLGALAVNGSIQVAMDNSTCDAAHAGMIRWNTSSKSFEGCTGPTGGWQELLHEPDTSWMLTTDNCGGFRQLNNFPGVRLAVSSSTTWDPSRRYDCPAGYHTATTAEGEAIFKGGVCCTDYYYSQCGWSGYSWAGAQRDYFRFSDSASTNAYVHAGWSEGNPPSTTTTTSLFAGVVCIRN